MRKTLAGLSSYYTKREEKKMWLRTTTDKNCIQRQDGYIYIDGEHTEAYYFDQKTAQHLEEDGFLTEMWHQFDALLDGGDCDFFEPDKCLKLQGWLKERLERKLKPDVREVYEVLLDYAEKAVKYDTGIDFDF